MIAAASALNRFTGSGHGLEKSARLRQNVEAQIIRVPTGVKIITRRFMAASAPSNWERPV